VHFAALKAVGESVLQAQRYYENNIIGLLTLTRAMSQANVKTLVFSSSATVYGNAVTMPITEDSALSATSPYGRTKLISEQILQDIGISDESWHIACLRYFNPVGAHQSGLIGEDPRGVPNNLMPYVAQVAVGAREKLSVFGGDYSTPDGTGVRDYIHVTDLAIGHLAALSYLFKEQKSFTANLGTGQGYSVLEVIRAYERASGKHIPFEIVGRRAGDVPVCYANPDYAKSLLNWQAMRNLNKMCEDSWRWQNANPKGYADN
jgi:UDP-glucose 4-epimerase